MRNQNELCHYGIIGMKWGVRRYQNSDGSYTAAGRARYGKSGGKRQSSRSNTGSEENDKSKKIKRAVTVGAAVAATVLVAYGAVKVSKNVKLNRQIEKVVQSKANEYARTKAKELSNVFVETLHEKPSFELFKSFYNDSKPSKEILLKEQKNLRKQYKQAVKEFRLAKRSYRRGKTRWIPNFDLDYNPLSRYEFRP